MNARALAWLAGTAVLLALSLTLTGYHADLFRKLLLTATLAVGYNFQFGIAGQIAFSHYAFYGIGWEQQQQANDCFRCGLRC